MDKGSSSNFLVGLGIGIIQQRLAEEKAYLEHLDLERVHRGDPRSPRGRKGAALQPGCVAFPQDNKFRCPKCGTEHNLVDARRQIEAQFKKPIVT